MKDNPDPFALLELVERAAPPGKQAKGEWDSHVVIEIDGWQIELFYDCGELDYIDHFITPEGERLNVWPDHQSVTRDMADWQQIVASWREVGDLQRLRELAAEWL